MMNDLFRMKFQLFDYPNKTKHKKFIIQMIFFNVIKNIKYWFTLLSTFLNIGIG